MPIGDGHKVECNECGNLKPAETNPRGIRKHVVKGRECLGSAVDPVSEAAPTVEAMDDELAAQYAEVSGFTSPDTITDAYDFPNRPFTVVGTDPVHGDLIQFDTPDQPGAAAGGTLLLSPALDFADPFDSPDLNTAEEDELNVSGQPKPRYAWRGSQNMGYLVKEPDTGDFRRYKNKSPKGLTRATTFNKAASSTTSLTGWKQRNVVIGASRRPDLLVRAHGLTHATGRRELDALVYEFEESAGAKVGADIGTYLHGFTEEMDAGLKTWRDAPPKYQAQLKLYAEALAKAGFETVPGLIERTTMIREFGGVVGTFDRILFHRPSGVYVVGDLKTGKTMDYARDETFCQEWIYAHGLNQSGVYDWNTDEWLAPWDDREGHDQRPVTVSEVVGLIVHMPVQGDDEGSVILEEADLVKGSEYAQLCYDVRSNVKPKRKLWSWAPPAPEPVLDNSTQPVVWEHLFASVQSGEEASALWLRAKEAGLQGLVLNDLVEIARNTLTKRGATSS